MAWATGRKYAVVTLYYLGNFIGSGSVWFFFHLEQGGSRNWAITQFFDLLWLVLEVSWCWWVCHSDANVISIKWGSNFTRSQIFYHPGPTWFYSWLCNSLKIVPLPPALLFQSDISHCIVQLKFAKRLDLWLSSSSLWCITDQLSKRQGVEARNDFIQKTGRLRRCQTVSDPSQCPLHNLVGNRVVIILTASSHGSSGSDCHHCQDTKCWDLSSLFFGKCLLYTCRLRNIDNLNFKLRHVGFFYVWEDANVWAPWNNFLDLGACVPYPKFLIAHQLVLKGCNHWWLI